jgi:hypothetical protein
MHRRQVAWQVILPVVLAVLVLIGVIVLLSWSTFRANGDVGRWAAISTMWLTLPVMIGGLFVLAILIGVTYLVGRVTGLLPRYSFPAQKYAGDMVAAAKKVEQIGHRPLRIFPEIGRVIRQVVRRVRRG